MHYGDINYDSKINLIDMLYLSDMINEDYTLIYTGDYNQDSYVDDIDFYEILQFLLSN